MRWREDQERKKKEKEKEKIIDAKPKIYCPHILSHNNEVTKAIKTSGAFEGLVAVVNRVTCSVPVPSSTLYVHAYHPAVPYLLLGLQDVQWAVGNSRGARKLARTPHVNQKKKKNIRVKDSVWIPTIK